MTFDFEEIAKITGTSKRQCEAIYDHLFRSLRDELTSPELNDIRIKELGVFRSGYHKVNHSILGIINILRSGKQKDKILTEEEKEEYRVKLRKLWIVYKKKQENKTKNK